MEVKQNFVSIFIIFISLLQGRFGNTSVRTWMLQLQELASPERYILKADTQKLFAFHFTAFLSYILELWSVVVTLPAASMVFVWIYILCVVLRCCILWLRRGEQVVAERCLCHYRASTHLQTKEPCWKCQQKPLYTVPAISFTWSMYQFLCLSILHWKTPAQEHWRAQGNNGSNLFWVF